MIYLQPHSGLANRIRVIISGLHFSDIVQHKLTIIWRMDDSLSSSFSDLFEKQEKFFVKDYDWFSKLLNKVQKYGAVRRLLFKLFSIDFSFFDGDVREYVWSTSTDNIDLDKLPKKVNNFYFSTCHEFSFDRYYLKYLRPAVFLLEKINENVSIFSDKTIGMHIRRTDHIESINNSPLEAFIDRIKKDLEIDAEVNYFVASDSEEVEIILKKMFPGKIITYPKDYSRTNTKGIQDAVVDLYSLSATSRIYGSYRSSFSDIAARIGNIPLEIIQSK